jgi:UTP--glucose-1-phosphate uridylyltransferase
MTASTLPSQTDTIRQAIITVAGRATRLLPATKQQPKSMLPLFCLGTSGDMVLMPILQRIFEQLFQYGAREFYFIVGKSKRAVQDHFGPDSEYVQYLNRHDKEILGLQLEDLYKKVSDSFLIWVNQPEPKGFGDAVLRAEGLVGTEPFLVHAGDTYVISETGIISRLFKAHMRSKATATLTLKEVLDPRRFGVAEVADNGDGTFLVERVVEKPAKPKSNLAIMAIYAFGPRIMEALKTVPTGQGGEVQLTDGIQKLIDSGENVRAIKMDANDHVLDIGTPDSYWEALEFSYHYYKSRSQHQGGE